LALPLIALGTAALGEVEHELISYLIARRERHPGATEPSALETARLRESLRLEALDALLTGTYAGEAAMRARAAQLGYDLAKPHAVLWVDLAPHLRATAPAISPHGTDPTAAHLADELAVSLGAWTRAQESQVAALLPVEREDSSLGEAARRASTLLAKILHSQSWAAGLGAQATT